MATVNRSSGTEMGLNMPPFQATGEVPAQVQVRFQALAPHHRAHSLQNSNFLLLRRSPLSHESGHLFPPQKKCVVEVSARNLCGHVVDEFELGICEAAVDFCCCCPSGGDLIYFVGEKGFYACNPSTRELVKLPEASHCTSGEVNAGLGYDTLRNEYVSVHLFDTSLNDFYDIIRCEILRFSDGEAVRRRLPI